ncbi:MAG: hypothetical protein AAB666_02050, partial [Patescibacteria group bacterium]
PTMAATPTIQASPTPRIKPSPSPPSSLTAIQTPAWFRDVVMYEIFVRSFYDSNGDGASSTPNQIGLEWQQMKFEGATSTLDNVIIRYANQSPPISWPNGSLYINNTPISINNLLLEYSSVPGVAVHLKNASQVEIKNSVIKNYAKNTLNYPSIGLKIDAGAPKISSTIVDTFNNGLQILNSPDLGGVEVEYIDAP